MVVDTKGQHFVNREKTDKGKFAFTTDNYDVFEICFISRVPANMRGGRWDQLYDVTFILIWENTRQTNSAHNIIVSRHEIFLATKHGVEAKNYEGLGDAAKLKPLEVIHMSHKCFQTASPNLSKLGRHWLTCLYFDDWTSFLPGGTEETRGSVGVHCSGLCSHEAKRGLS